MNSDTITLLRHLADDLGPADADLTESQDMRETLPEQHRELLGRLNGFTLADGAMRLFGFRSEPYLSLRGWNAHETWKFAWGDDIEQFLCFGETGWGDQYAYRRLPGTSLVGPEVYFLEGSLLRAEVISESFETFVRDEILRNAAEPYDEMSRGALEKLGPLPANDHWILTPPITLGGTELIENIGTLPAETAMIFAGDIAVALSRSEPGTAPRDIEPWSDDMGRARLRVRFA